MLVLNSSGIWRVGKERFSSFVDKSMFTGVSLMIIQCQFISVDNLKFVNSLLKQLFSEDVTSKSCIILIGWNSVTCVF